MVIHEPLKRIIIALYAKFVGKDTNYLREEFIHIILLSIIVLLLSTVFVYSIMYIKQKFEKIKIAKI